MGGESLGKVAGRGDLREMSSDSPAVSSARWASHPLGDPKQLLTRTFTLKGSLAMLSTKGCSRAGNASPAGPGRGVHALCSCGDSNHQIPTPEGRPGFYWKVG